MKISELIKQLEKLPQDAEVIISNDSEGNGFSKLHDIESGTVPPEELNQYHIDEFYSDNHTDDQCCLEPGERKQFTKVICLWP